METGVEETLPMRNLSYGIAAGLIGAAFAYWWRQQHQQEQHLDQARGEVIFHNNPLVGTN